MNNNFKLQAGDILVNVNDRRNPYHSLKRWLIGPYDHVFAYLGEIWLDTPGGEYGSSFNMMVESNGRGVTLRNINERYGNKVVVMRLLPEYQNDDILSKIRRTAIILASSEQAYYDYFAVVQYVIPQAILQKLHLEKLIPLSWHRDKRMICSEAIFEIYYNAGIKDILPQSIGLKNFNVVLEFLVTWSIFIGEDPIEKVKRKYLQIPMPGDFVGSPCMEHVSQGAVSPDWIE